MNEKEKGRAGKRAAAAAVAVAAAAGVLLSGLFPSPRDLLSEDAAPPNAAYIDTLLPDGDDGGDGGDQDDQAPEKSRRRSLRAILRERVLRLPAAARALVLLPLWLLGSGISALGGALFSAASPLAQGILKFLLTAAALLGAFVLAAKAVFPDLPLNQIFNRRTLPFLGLGALALTALDRLSAAVWPEYEQLRQAVAAGGFLLVLCAAMVSLAFRQRRRREAEAAAEPAALPDKLRFTDAGGDFILKTEIR